jgi:pyruvate,orthophosphate dikinase
MLGAVAMLQPELSGDFGLIMEWADATRGWVRTNAETPPMPRRALLRRRRHRPVPHRAHVLRRRPHHRHARDDPGRKRKPGAARRWPSCCRCSAICRAVRDHGRPAGHHPPARSAAARVPAQAPTRRSPKSPIIWTSRELLRASASMSCTNSTRCSAIAAAGWRSPTRKLPRCRPAPSSRPPSRRRRTLASAGRPGSHGPAVGLREELDFVKARIDAVAREVIGEAGVDIEYLVGTMIELPRACHPGGRDCRSGRVLLLRHQRPDPDHLRHFARRRLVLPDDLPAERHHRTGPVRHARYRRRRRTGAHRIRQGQGNPARHQARYLR